jgi:Glycosyl hydrolase family 52
MTNRRRLRPVVAVVPAAAVAGPFRLGRWPGVARPLHGHAPRFQVGTALLTLLAVLALLVPSAARPRTEPAWADSEPIFAPVAWKRQPTNDSVEMGDHSLNLNFSFGEPNDVVSSAAHNIHFGTRGTPSGFSVLLRTTSDGATRELPPTEAVSSRLSSVRVGLTATSTLVEGTNAGLKLTYQVTKPYLPSESADELDSRITNGPFMYLRLQVKNTSASPRPAAAVYAGFNSSCGPVLDQWPKSGWWALQLCNSGDTGGTRYLAAPRVPGSTWGTSTDTVADFQLDGMLSGGDGSGKAAIALPVPALAAGAQYTTTLVYGAWHDTAGIAALDGTRYKFYYRGWWANPAAMLRFAIDNADAAFAGSASFDARVREVSPDTGAQYGAVHAFRGWRHANWLVRRPDGRPFYAVTEGGFNYLSTLDVAYDYHAFQTRYEPWKSKLELDEWRDRYELDGNGNKFLLHDLGQDSKLTVGPAYDLRSGVRRHMPIEHNLDMVTMVFAWERRTGRTYDRTLVQELLDSAEAHDTDQDGGIDVAVMTACLPDGGTCRTSQLGTTYDGSLPLASKVQAGNTILTTKMGVVESFASSRGYAPRSGASYGTRAQHHLAWAERFKDHVSSNRSLDGHAANPGYLADALLYAPILGSNPILDAALSSWLNQALIDNQRAVYGPYPASAIARNSSSDTITWISKAVAGDAVGAWIRRQWPGWTTLRPDGPKLWNAWNRRSSGEPYGTFDSANYPSNSYRSAGWYPRAVSIWASAPDWAFAPPVP